MGSEFPVWSRKSEEEIGRNFLKSPQVLYYNPNMVFKIPRRSLPAVKKEPVIKAAARPHRLHPRWLLAHWREKSVPHLHRRKL